MLTMLISSPMVSVQATCEKPLPNYSGSIYLQGTSFGEEGLALHGGSEEREPA